MPTTILPAGRKKRIHVVGQAIARNKKRARNRGAEPVFTVQTSKGPVHGRQVKVTGTLVFQQDFERRLKSGAVAWADATDAVVEVLP